MLALFEVLSLEGWLEVRDVIIERAGPVRIQLITLEKLFCYFPLAESRHLHSPFCVHWLYDRLDSFCGCCHCTVHGKQGKGG
jgi:hypothetical protein